MTNETFLLLSEEDRNTKLRAVLKNKSAGCLTEDEIQGILQCVSLNRQYRVSVSYGRAEFARVMAAANDLSCQIVFPLSAMKKSLTGETLAEDEVIAAIAGNLSEADGANQILIYIPKQRKKGNRDE